MHRFMLFGVALTLLLTATGGVCHTATAQQSTIDTDAPVMSLDEAVRAADSDSTLVDLAVALQSARADTKISFHEYDKGVRLFKQHHPGFYGNYFGDPFYATYDARYQHLTRERRLAASEIDLRHNFQSNTWFFCWPSSYDPAFGGDCRGLRFAASDFFFLPSGPAFAQRTPGSQERLQNRENRGDYAPLRGPSRSSPSVPDTAGRSASDAPSPVVSDAKKIASNTREAGETVGSELEVDPVPTTEGIDVPDEASFRMHREASMLRQEEIRMRIRRTIEEEFGGRENLTPEARTRLASRLAERPPFSNNRADVSIQVRDRLERLDPTSTHPERPERDPSGTEWTSPPDRPSSPHSPEVEPPTSDGAGAGNSSPSHPPTSNTSDRDDDERNASDDSGTN